MVRAQIIKTLGNLGTLAAIALMLVLIFGGSIWLANVLQSIIDVGSEIGRIITIVLLVFVAIIVVIMIYPPEELFES